MFFDLDDLEDDRRAPFRLAAQEIGNFSGKPQKGRQEGQYGIADLFGYRLYCIPCERDVENKLCLQADAPSVIREALETIPRSDYLSERGIATAEWLFVFWGTAEGPGKVFVTNRAAAVELLSQTFPQARLTDAEASVALDLLVGHELRETADRDGLSYETKRTLLKRVLQKTETGKQSHLVSRIVGEFLLAAHGAQYTAETNDLTSFRTWLSRHFPPDQRAYSIYDEMGELHHVLDIGARGGHPIVAFMPMFFPYFCAEQIKLLAERGLRLLIPLRRGTLMSAVQHQTPDTFLTSVMRGGQLAADLHAASQVTVMGIGNAAGYAARFATAAADQVDHLVLVSPLFSQANGARKIDRLRHSFSRLANGSPLLQTKALRYLDHLSNDQTLLKQCILKIADALPSDRALLEKMLSVEGIVQFYHDYAPRSQGLFLIDTHPELALQCDSLDDVAQPVSMFRGENDDMYPKSFFDQCFAGHVNVTQYTLPDTGHVLMLEKMDQFINILADRIAAQPS